MLSRFLSLILGLAVLALIAYWTVNHIAGAERPDPEGRSQPKAILDHTREATQRFERESEQRIRETERKLDEAR